MAIMWVLVLSFAAQLSRVAAHYHPANVTCENTPEVCVTLLEVEASTALRGNTSQYRRNLLNGRGLRTLPYGFTQASSLYPRYVEYFKEDIEKNFPGGNMVMPLAFHIVKKSESCTHYSCGHVPRANIIAQVNQLNKAFSGGEARPRSPRTTITSSPDTKIRFKLHSISYHADEIYWSKCWDKNGGTMKRMRYRMAVHPEMVTNVYTCQAAMSIGFVANYMWEASSAYQVNGVAVHTPVVTNNGDSYYNQGDIMVHEMGHHLGIAHPYDGACLSGEVTSSDGVADTPRMAGNVVARDYGSQAGCPANLDTCPGSSTGLNGGKDIVDNYMVATSDECRWEFTPGQVEWMHAAIVYWRPTYLENKDPGCVTAMDETDNSPNNMPCWFGDWGSAAPYENAGYMDYGGKRYTMADGPITDKAPPGFAGSWTDSRGWCFNDNTKTTWGYACCAHSRGEDCLAPSKSNDAPATLSPVTPPPTPAAPGPSSSPTSGPTKAPSNPPPAPPTSPPVLPPLECYVDGGPFKRRNARTAFSKCQFPFTFNGVTYNDCLSIQDNPPKWMRNIENPKDHRTRDTLWCPWKVHGKSRVFQYGKKGNGFKRNWGFCRCNYYTNEPKGHHYDSTGSATITDGRCDLNIGCENCNTRALCERRCDEDVRCKAYVFDEAFDACKFRTCAAKSDMHSAPGSSTVAVKGKEAVTLHTLSSGMAHDSLEALGESESDESLEEDYYYGEDSSSPPDNTGTEGDKKADSGGAMTAVAAAGGGAAAVLLIGMVAFGVRRRLQGGGLGQRHESVAGEDDLEDKVTPAETSFKGLPAQPKAMQQHASSELSVS